MAKTLPLLQTYRPLDVTVNQAIACGLPYTLNAL
jgi:hypothetical protein